MSAGCQIHFDCKCPLDIMISCIQWGETTQSHVYNAQGLMGPNNKNKEINNIIIHVYMKSKHIESLIDKKIKNKKQTIFY